MTTATEDVGEALADLAILAREKGHPDLAAEAESVRRDSPRKLALVATEGADAPRLAAWIARTVPDLALRIVDTTGPADGLGKIALVLRADRLVDAAVQDQFATLSFLAAGTSMAVVVTGAGALGEGEWERVGRGLGRALRPETNAHVDDLPAYRIFLFEDGQVQAESAREPLEKALAAFVAWLREPAVPDSGHRATLGLRILSALESAAESESPSAEPTSFPTAERLRTLAARVVRQFESEFDTASASVESSLRSLERDVDGVLRRGERGSEDRTTPVDVRVDLWEAKAHDAVETMLARTREYAEGLLRDVPWDALEARAASAGLPGDFKGRLLAAWREADEEPFPHLGESVRKGLGDTPTVPQVPAALQAGLGLFGGAVAYLLLGPVVGISLAVAGVAGSVAGARGSRQAASDLAPVFAQAQTQFAENMGAYLDRIRTRTVAILDEAANAVAQPVPDSTSDSNHVLLALRERLARAVAPSYIPDPHG